MMIAILPGDGIGPEIVDEAVKVLGVLRAEGLAIETEAAPIGGAGYDAAGHPLPPATLQLARDADAILMGAVGGYAVGLFSHDGAVNLGWLMLGLSGCGALALAMLLRTARPRP